MAWHSTSREMNDPIPDPLITPPPTVLGREERWFSLGHRGATIWLTGLPGSGKSTLAAGVEQRLVSQGQPAYRLDGDALRAGLNRDLGFDEAGRNENLRRVAEVARLFADAGLVAIVSAISPLRAHRDLARSLHHASGLLFMEVFVDTPIEVCEARDPKGHYAMARAGELAGFTGVGGVYERPDAAELRLDPDRVEKNVDQILWRLDELSVPTPCKQG
ncbi:MAG: adenylyl-sulfate kinase [Myxococcales bacterium]|nr:adenylyl-sulfate kinase [Myxococcales bacterium]